jgi:hypothetical protein
MATSGTVGNTVLDTAKLIEKTYRRCGIPTGGITPELIDIAKENLFLLFQNLSNRGVNLWCIDSPILGMQDHNNTYNLPVGTIGILNASRRRVTTLADTLSASTATSVTYDMGTATTVSMVGFILSAATTGVTISGSSDNITFTTYRTETKAYATGVWNWVELDASATVQYWRLTFPTATTVTSHSLSSAYTDITMSRLNWDDYLNLPNKRLEGSEPLQYAFDRQMTQTMVLWPVPNDMANMCVILRTHRQIQDVGSLTQTIEVPDRWIDTVSWNLSAMCAVEVPTVPQDRIQLCQQMAGESLQNADREEVDGSATTLLPNIGVYNA